jgi:hypothetical protein
MNGHVVVTPPLHAFTVALLQNWRRALFCQHTHARLPSPRRRCAALTIVMNLRRLTAKVDGTMTHSVSLLANKVESAKKGASNIAALSLL